MVELRSNVTYAIDFRVFQIEAVHARQYEVHETLPESRRAAVWKTFPSMNPSLNMREDSVHYS